MQSAAHSPVNKSLVLILVMVTSFMTPFMSTAVSLALPVISNQFSLNAISMSWVAMSFLLATAVFMVPMGKLSDILGRKKVFIWGNLIVAASSILCALSWSGEVLIAMRVIQGFGSAMMFATSMALITSVYPPKERGKAIGLSVTAVYVGLSASPVIGGFLIGWFGWESLFYVPAPIGIAVAIISYLAIKTDWREAQNEQFDYRGSLLYLVAMSAFMYGFSQLPDPTAIALTVVGAIGIVLFIRVELKATFPVLNMQLFAQNRHFALSNLAALINYATTFAITFLLSLYLEYIKGLSPSDAGILLVTQPAMMALVASFAGRLSDKYDSGWLASGGMAIIAVGLVMLIPLNEATTTSYLIASLAILGFGFGLFSSPNTNAIMSSVEKKYLGIASATVGTMRLTGQMMSMGIATLIIHLFMGSAKIVTSNHPQFMHSARVTFAIFVALCILGIWASLARGKNEHEHAKK